MIYETRRVVEQTTRRAQNLRPPPSLFHLRNLIRRLCSHGYGRFVSSQTQSGRIKLQTRTVPLLDLSTTNYRGVQIPSLIIRM